VHFYVFTSILYFYNLHKTKYPKPQLKHSLRKYKILTKSTSMVKSIKYSALKDLDFKNLLQNNQTKVHIKFNIMLILGNIIIITKIV